MDKPRHLRTTTDLPITIEAPPVDERPRYPWCGKVLVPIYEEVIATGEVAATFRSHDDPNDPVRREFRGRYHGYGAFCRLRCGCHWANREWRKLNG